MLLNCDVGEDCWESLGLQGDPTSPFWRRSALGFLWKDWCWSWNSNTLAIWCKELTYWKRPDAWKDWRQEEKGTTEDEMVGWHHQLDGLEFEQALEVGDGQGSLVCCTPWSHKESDMIDWLNLTVLYSRISLIHSIYNSLHLLTPNSQSILPLYPCLLTTIRHNWGSDRTEWEWERFYHISIG